jgi:hypothetical protein
MSKSIQYTIIAISIASIIFSIISIIEGQPVIDASGGFLIGLCLLAVLFVEKKDQKNNNKK